VDVDVNCGVMDCGGEWWYFLADISGQHTGPTGIGRFSRNMDKKLYSTSKVFQYAGPSPFV
jgi:hypothetical protein